MRKASIRTAAMRMLFIIAKTRNLWVAVCVALVILGMQSRAAAQENKFQGPPAREGSWDLIRIETTSRPFNHGLDPRLFPRQSKDLPVGTRERKGITWGYEDSGLGGGLRINADVLFTNLKETVTIIDNTNQVDFDPDLFVKAEVIGKIGTSFVVFKYTADIQTSSGYDAGKDYSKWDKRIYPGPEEPIVKTDNRFLKKGEWKWNLLTFGGHPKAEEDFTFNVRLLVFTGGVTLDYPASESDMRDPGHVDITYHFHYKWKGWREPGKPATSGSTSSPGDAGVGPLDRDGQYRWAQKQEASTLESRLISNAARLFGSPSVTSEKLSSAFADVSVIIADRAAKANFSSDDKDAASTNWSTHKNWAARQGPKVSLDNLQQRLSAAFKYLSRSQQDLFFADVSVAMAKAEVAEPANQAAAAQDGPFVKPQKDVFAVGETITIDYSDDKGTGWDWVVIVQPGKEKVATGNFSAINPSYGLNLDPATNEMKEQRGRASFPDLPEGDYEAHYISWAGARNHRAAGNNDLTAVASFKVRNAPPPAANPGLTTNPPTANPAKDLTGLWRNPGGSAVYRFRQIGNKLHWGIDAVPVGSFANVFEGDISSAKIEGSWIDLPGSPFIGGGKLSLKIESECKIVKTGEVNHYGAEIWVKQNSQCDVAAQAQRTSEVGAKPTTTKTSPATQAKAKPKVEEIPENVTPPQKPQSGSRTTQTASNTTQNKTSKPPVVEEIPENNSTKIAAGKPPIKTTTKPPVVEVIPEDNSTKVAASKPPIKTTTKPPVVEAIPEDNTKIASNRSRAKSPAVKEIPKTITSNPSSSTSKPNNPAKEEPKKEKPKKEKKPKDPNQPDIWTRLGRAVRQGIEQQPTQQQPTNQQPAQQPTQQPNGQCRGGSYWLGTPTPNSWRLGTPGAGVQIPWSTPLGVTGAKIFIFHAGTNNRLTDSALPENANACGLSWSIYPNAAGYFDAYMFQGTTPVAGPVRFVVTQ